MQSLIRLVASVAVAVAYSDQLCQQTSVGCSTFAKASSLAHVGDVGDGVSMLSAASGEGRSVPRWTSGFAFDHDSVRAHHKSMFFWMSSTVALGIIVGSIAVLRRPSQAQPRPSTIATCPVFYFNRSIIVIQSQVRQEGLSWTRVNVRVGERLEIHVSVYEVRFVQMTIIFQVCRNFIPSLLFHVSTRLPNIAVQDVAAISDPCKSIALRSPRSVANVPSSAWRHVIVAIPMGGNIIIFGWSESVLQLGEHIAILFRIYYPHIMLKRFTKTRVPPHSSAKETPLHAGCDNGVFEELDFQPTRLITYSQSSREDQVPGWAYSSQRNVLHSLVVPDHTFSLCIPHAKEMRFICAPTPAPPRRSIRGIMVWKPRIVSYAHHVKPVVRGLYDFVPRTSIARMLTPASETTPPVRSKDVNSVAHEVDSAGVDTPEAALFCGNELHHEATQVNLSDSFQKDSEAVPAPFPTHIAVSIRVLCPGTYEARKVAKVVDVQVPLNSADNKFSVDIELDSQSGGAITSEHAMYYQAEAPLPAAPTLEDEDTGKQFAKINEKIEKMTESIEDLKKSLRAEIASALLESLRQMKADTMTMTVEKSVHMDVKTAAAEQAPKKKTVIFASAGPSAADMTYDSVIDELPDNCVTSFSPGAYSPAEKSFRNIVDSIDRPNHIAPRTPFQEFQGFEYYSEEIDPTISPAHSSPNLDDHADDLFTSGVSSGPLLIPRVPGYMLALYDKRVPVSPCDKLASICRRAKSSSKSVRYLTSGSSDKMQADGSCSPEKKTTSPCPSAADTAHDSVIDEQPDNCVTSLSSITYSPVAKSFKNIPESVDRPNHLAPRTSLQELNYYHEMIDPIVSPAHSLPKHDDLADDLFTSGVSSGPVLIPRMPGYMLALYDKRVQVSPCDKLASACRRAKSGSNSVRCSISESSENAQADDSCSSEQLPEMNMSQIIAPIKVPEQMLLLDEQVAGSIDAFVESGGPSDELVEELSVKVKQCDDHESRKDVDSTTHSKSGLFESNAGVIALTIDKGLESVSPVDAHSPCGEVVHNSEPRVIMSPRPRICKSFQLKSRFVNLDANVERLTQTLPPTPVRKTSKCSEELKPIQIASTTPLCSPTKRSDAQEMSITGFEGHKNEESADENGKISDCQVVKEGNSRSEFCGGGVETMLQSLTGLVATRINHVDGVSSKITGKDGILERFELMKRNMAKHARSSSIPVPTLRRLLLDKQLGSGSGSGSGSLDKSQSVSPASTLVNSSGGSVGSVFSAGSNSGFGGDMKADLPSKIPRFSGLANSKFSHDSRKPKTSVSETCANRHDQASPESWSTGWEFEKAMSQETRFFVLQSYRDMRKKRTRAEEIANADKSHDSATHENARQTSVRTEEAINILDNVEGCDEEAHTSFSLCVYGERLHDESIEWLDGSTSSIF